MNEEGFAGSDPKWTLQSKYFPLGIYILKALETARVL